MEVSEGQQVGSDELGTGRPCDPCKGEDQEENAVCYCTVCNEYLCEVCAKAHEKLTISKDHKLLDQYDMPKQKLTSEEESTCMCTKHTGKLVEYYCQVHDDWCCSVCVTLEHKTCTIRYIDDIVKEFGTSGEYTALMSSLADVIQSLHNTKTVAVKKKDDVGLIYTTFVSEVKKYRSEINTILYSLEQRTLTDAKTLRDMDDKSTESASTTCGKSIADLERLSSKLANHEKYKQQRQLVVSVNRAKTQIKQYESKTAELEKQCSIRDYTFRPNETISHVIGAEEGLGKLEHRTEDEINKKESQVIKPEEPSLPSTCKSVVSLRYVGEVEVRLSSDKNNNGCWITGGVMLDNNLLALADYNNSCIKIIDVNINKIVSFLTLPVRPRDITRVGRDQIVVTCPNGLMFLQVGIPLSLVKTLKTGSQCHGIVYTDNVLIVSFMKPDGIKVIDLDGNTLRSILTDKEGQSLFEDPYYMALSTDQKTLFISNMTTNTVTSMDLDGNVQHVYKHDKLVNPFGLAVDREDNIYIAGFNSSNIHIMSPQCTTVHTVKPLRPGMEYPQAVIYCDRENKLYVSPCNKNRDTDTANNRVDVYQIE